MGQQVAFIILIVLWGIIFIQILMSAKNEKTRYEVLNHEIKMLKEKLGLK